MPIRRFLLVLAFALASFVHADDVWCGVCTNFFDAPKAAHIKEHADRVKADFCKECDGIYKLEHQHFEKWFKDEAKRKKEAENAGEAKRSPSTPSHPSEPEQNLLLDAISRLAPLKRFWWVVPAILAIWLILLPMLKALLSRPRTTHPREFPMVGGVPQGVELVPGHLVCSENGKDDGGGTAIGYPAMVRLGRKWSPAFVKRMVGRGMRQDVRFPALRFEADVLERLKTTGAVPRLLVPPTETTLADGKYWAYYAMSVAPGEQWPVRGGLGDDTHRALSALCEALVRIHDLGIGHHDLKPQNLFWDARRHLVTLIDLGSAIDHSGGLVNPLGATYPATLPWVAPKSDGTCLANLSLASDAWVYGLILCEALVGGVHDPDRTKRRWPEKPDDREWFFRRLSEAESADLARAVVDGLFALQASRRMTLSAFLEILRKDWGL